MVWVEWAKQVSPCISIIRFLEKKIRFFHHVFYVTASRDSNLYKLQNNVAKAFGLHHLEYDELLWRAAELKQVLTKRKGSLLILDDVWKSISMAAVGVCVEGDGCKLLITTRRRDVCRKMKCFPVKIDPLSAEESWELFKKQLGNYEELTGEVQEIARKVAKECKGLPLGIITMAGCMRGELMEDVWNNALGTLKDPSRSQHDPDMEDNVFKILRFSYDRLYDENHKMCFLYCALYAEDYQIERDELISQFIGEGFLEGSTRQEKIDRGRTLLNALENASLLESVTYLDCVKMHDLVRDMAIKIIGPTGLVKGGNRLKEIPGELRRINENVKWVSLMQNVIVEIGDVPNCPNVSSLLLQNSGWLKFISESFFVHMIGLNVLNLSWTRIKKLPDSVSDLVNLKALLLSDCLILDYIPPIRKLTKLRELVLRRCCDLKELPEGMEELVGLEVLNVYPSGIKGTLSLLKLVKLESFESNCKIVVQQPNEVLLCLRNLTRLDKFLFCDANWANHCIDLSGLNQLKTYAVHVGSSRYLMFRRYGMSFVERKLYVGGFKLSIGKEVRLEVPHNVEFLNFCNCRFGGKSLLDNVPSLRCAFELKEFVIVSCEGIESIISEGGDSKGLAGIQKLKLERLDDLIGLIREEEVHPYISFASLRRLEINKCGKVKKLWRLNTDLPNLEEVEVQSCEQMELVFVTERGATIKFPRLRSVVLCDLPELRSICDNGVFFLALVNLQVTNCNKVKKLGLKLSGNLNSLRDINVSLCNQLEELFQVVDRAEDDPIQFPSLEDLKLFDLPKLPCLEKLSLSDLPELSLRDLGEDFKFPQLHTLEVMNCPNVKKLTLLSHRLPSLTSLLVSGCHQIEQIFAEEDVEDITSLDIQWPNLTELRLLQLPKLRSICKNTIVCDSLELVELDDSSNGKLENFPISMPILIDRGESWGLPVLKVWNVSKDWWLSLRWNNSDTKVILHRLGCFTSEICHTFDLNIPDPEPCDLDLHL